jgi:hypothetical protein
MTENYLTEEGCCWDIEELAQFAQFKVKELLDQHYSDDKIIDYDDSDLWKYVAQDVIKNNRARYMKEISNMNGKTCQRAKLLTALAEEGRTKNEIRMIWKI